MTLAIIPQYKPCIHSVNRLVPRVILNNMQNKTKQDKQKKNNLDCLGFSVGLSSTFKASTHEGTSPYDYD